MGWDGGIEPKIAAGCEIEKTFVEPSYLPSSSRRKMYLLWIQNRLSLNTEQCFLRFWLKLTFVTLVYKSIRMLFTGFAEKKAFVFLISSLTVTFDAVLSLNIASMAPFPAILWRWIVAKPRSGTQTRSTGRTTGRPSSPTTPVTLYRS